MTPSPPLRLLAALRRRWLLLLEVSLIVAVLGAGAAALHPDTWTSTAQVRVVTPDISPPLGANDPNSKTTDRDVATALEVARSDAVTQAAARTLRMNPGKLSSDVKLTTGSTSDLIAIAGRGRTAREAQATASAFTAAFTDQLRSGGLRRLISSQDVLQHRATECGSS